MSSESQYRILFLSTGNAARSISLNTSFEWLEKAASRLTALGPIPCAVFVVNSVIPADACEIDNLHQATPAQLKQLQDGFAVTEAIQEIRRREFTGKETKRKV